MNPYINRVLVPPRGGEQWSWCELPYFTPCTSSPVQVSLFCKESTEAFTTADAASGTWAVISL